MAVAEAAAPFEQRAQLQALAQQYTADFAAYLDGLLDELPLEVRAEVVKFSEMNVHWLARVLALKGKGKGGRAGSEAIRRRALAIF